MRRHHNRLDRIEAEATPAPSVVPVRVDVGEDPEAAHAEAAADAPSGASFVRIIRVNEAPPPDSQRP